LTTEARFDITLDTREMRNLILGNYIPRLSIRGSLGRRSVPGTYPRGSKPENRPLGYILGISIRVTRSMDPDPESHSGLLDKTGVKM